MVPQAGLEPARPFGQQILSLPRLPFRHWGTGRLDAARIIAGGVGRSMELSATLAMAETPLTRRRGPGAGRRGHPFQEAEQLQRQVVDFLKGVRTG